MLESFNSIIEFLFNSLSQVATLYTTIGLLTAVIALWVFVKIVNYIKRLLP